eukprot:gnl/MRDRNA2_/MRDRNA2_130838_c0_seq1.p1 gnl/MRDRNA2_/MRDRNA2_130838_c0~~gnl/MRDRNA2_/MRDRNA2_130838_c0_seq1.p1  ORF type:complete len:342 (-),score=55.78 gnl/MRDRNA2_/MRDRNA2_130838_c0_seq1:274-1299(-)
MSAQPWHCGVPLKQRNLSPSPPPRSPQRCVTDPLSPPGSVPKSSETRVFPAHSGDHKAARAKVESDDDHFINTYKGGIFNYTSWPASRGNQGCLPPMIFDFFSVIDADGEGALSAEELDEAADIIRIAKKAKSNNSAELNYKHLPKVVSEVLTAWDLDRSGSVSVSELVSAAEAQRRMSDENRLMKKLLVVAVAAIICILCAMLGICLWVAETTKDSRPDALGIQRLPGGSIVATGQVIENVNIADYAALSCGMLQRAQSVQFITSGGWHFYKVASMTQSPEGDVAISTPDQHTIIVFPNRTVLLDGKNVLDGMNATPDAVVSGSGSFLTRTGYPYAQTSC